MTWINVVVLFEQYHDYTTTYNEYTDKYPQHQQLSDEQLMPARLQHLVIYLVQQEKCSLIAVPQLPPITLKASFLRARMRFRMRSAERRRPTTAYITASARSGGGV